MHDVLRQWGHADEELVNDAAFVTSELATNEVVHAGTAFSVGICILPAEQLLRLSVRDASPDMSTVGDFSRGPRTSWGLSLVADIASCWGVEQFPKRRWCGLSSPSNHPDDAFVLLNDKPGSGGPVTVCKKYGWRVITVGSGTRRLHQATLDTRASLRVGVLTCSDGRNGEAVLHRSVRHATVGMTESSHLRSFRMGFYSSYWRVHPSQQKKGGSVVGAVGWSSASSCLR